MVPQKGGDEDGGEDEMKRIEAAEETPRLRDPTVLRTQGDFVQALHEEEAMEEEVVATKLEEQVALEREAARHVGRWLEVP